MVYAHRKKIKVIHAASKRVIINLGLNSIGRINVLKNSRVTKGKDLIKSKNNPRMYIPVFGNGDVNSPEKAKEMRDDYGLDLSLIHI